MKRLSDEKLSDWHCVLICDEFDVTLSTVEKSNNYDLYKEVTAKFEEFTNEYGEFPYRPNAPLLGVGDYQRYLKELSDYKKL